MYDLEVIVCFSKMKLIFDQYRSRFAFYFNLSTVLSIKI